MRRGLSAPASFPGRPHSSPVCPACSPLRPGSATSRPTRLLLCAAELPYGRHFCGQRWTCQLENALEALRWGVGRTQATCPTGGALHPEESARPVALGTRGPSTPCSWCDAHFLWLCHFSFQDQMWHWAHAAFSPLSSLVYNTYFIKAGSEEIGLNTSLYLREQAVLRTHSSRKVSLHSDYSL